MQSMTDFNGSLNSRKDSVHQRKKKESKQMQSVMEMMRKTQQMNQRSIMTIDEDYDMGGIFNNTTNFYGKTELQSRLTGHSNNGRKGGRHILLPKINTQEKFSIKGSTVDETQRARARFVRVRMYEENRAQSINISRISNYVDKFVQR